MEDDDVRERKMMMSRRRMLRRKTMPGAGPTLFTGQMPCPGLSPERGHAIEMHANMSEELRKSTDATDQNEPRTQTHTLCEAARSKSK